MEWGYKKIESWGLIECWIKTESILWIREFERLVKVTRDVWTISIKCTKKLTQSIILKWFQEISNSERVSQPWWFLQQFWINLILFIFINNKDEWNKPISRLQSPIQYHRESSKKLSC